MVEGFKSFLEDFVIDWKLILVEVKYKYVII